MNIPISCKSVLESESETITCADMCFVISECLCFDNKKLTPDEIWNSSPSGELFHIMLLYQSIKDEYTKGINKE
jgi:hypothetical protein